MVSREPQYYYRAFFRPDQIEAIAHLHQGLDSWGKGTGYAQVWHKGNTEKFCQNCVANEIICGEIGHFLQLPVPPFAITYRDAGSSREPLFSSLDFNFDRAKLPQVDPQNCVRTLPRLCTGVLLFDVLIANCDRHDENMVVDRVQGPREMHIFDHGHALLGPFRSEGLGRLSRLRDRLGITGGYVSDGVPHVLLDYVTSYKHFREWMRRIHDIPDWFISGLCDQVKRIGLVSDDEAKAIEGFLLYRKDNLVQIVDAHRAEFSVTDWPSQQRLLP